MTAQARRSFRPGGWFGIFGEHATVLLPPSEKARVAALWELVDEGAGFDETLDALLSTGLRDLPGFVLVSPVEHGTKVVLRGAAVAHFELADQTVEVAGSTDTTWVERLLTGVVRMSVQVEAAADDVEPLTIGTGLVRLARVDEPPVEEQSTEAPAEEPVAEEPVAEEPVAEEPVAEEPAGEEPVAEEPPTEEPVAEEPTPVGPVDLGDPGDPVPDPVPDDQPTEFLPPPAQHRALPEEPPGPERPVARLHFSSGQLVDVDRMVLVGRAPEAARYTLSDEPRVVQVASPHQEISATHLEVRPGGGLDRGSAVVTDLGSTNGTVLIQPGQVPQDLHPGIAVVLVPGAIIDLGDGISIQVEAV